MTTSDARKRNADRGVTFAEAADLIKARMPRSLATPDQENPMTKHDRHDELKALLSKISEESVTTSNVLADVLDLLRERLPERTEVKVAPFDPDLAARNLDALKHAVSKPIEVVTEEPPVGTYLADRDGDVWERREDGWVDWAPEPRTWGYVFEFEEVRTRYAPLRLATPADLARVGIEPEPAQGMTRCGTCGTERPFDAICSACEPAPTDDLPGEPVEPCGRDVGDATYCPCLLPRSHDGLHSCKHTEPAPTDDLPGEPVEPGDLRAGDRVEFAWEKTGEDIACTLVNFHDGSALYSDVPDSGGYRPNVVWNGVWCHGITDVRLIERAPREDEDPDEVLAMDLYHASLKIPPAAKVGPSAWDDFTRRQWLDVARAAREHIEQEIPEELDKIGITWQSRARRMGKRAEKAETERDEWREVAARYADGRDKWQAKWRESDEARERAEAERDALRERLDALRADVERFSAGDPLITPLDILARDDERAAKGGQR